MNVAMTQPRVLPVSATAVPKDEPAPVEPKSPERVVVVGAGPAGMATAIELAQQGIHSVVLEKREGPATRENLFAVSGPYADRLAALDPDGSLLKLLTPSSGSITENLVTGARTVKAASGGLQADPSRSRGDMSALLRANGAPGEQAPDTRQWSKVPIGDIEEGLRNLARSKHSDMIELRQGVDVTGLRQGDGWAEAVVSGAGGTSDAIRGAMLVDASGRDLLGGPRTVYPEQSHWIGGRFAPPADHQTTNVRRTSVTEEGPDPLVTIKLPSEDRTLVWAQVPTSSAAMTPEQRTAIVERRAKELGVEGGLAVAGRTAPVSIQLWVSNEPAKGRILKVGDSVRAPYFPTSTGAASALVHDAPRAVDAIRAVLGGADVQQTAAAYSDAVIGANQALLGLSRKAMLNDLGIDPAKAGEPTVVEQAPTGEHSAPQLS
jgi:2-polyprenyl-6-methoxyphenol hydroxylase-like FAD-dependent oxidoreductase